ncbi:Sperm flagellar protein 1 [Kappamyces sp. JEL0829]|nr:Sperm flagellar protein 1 [Kappamyces sp. JEL0829]
MQELSDRDLSVLYAWIDSGKYSRPKRSLARDFADGVACAELLATLLPRILDLHNYQPGSSVAHKLYNWHCLNTKVFAKLGYTTSGEVINGIVRQRPGYVDYLLWDLRSRVLEYKAVNGDRPSSRHRAASAKTHSVRSAYMKKQWELAPLEPLTGVQKWEGGSRASEGKRRIRIQEPADDRTTDPASAELEKEPAEEELADGDGELIQQLMRKMHEMELALKEKEQELQKLKEAQSRGGSMGAGAKPRSSNGPQGLSSRRNSDENAPAAVRKSKPSKPGTADAKGVAVGPKSARPEPQTIKACTFPDESAADRAQIVVHLRDGKSRTVTYTQENSSIDVTEGEPEFTGPTTYLEFTTTAPFSYTWTEFEKWVRSSECGFSNFRDQTHNCKTFVRCLVEQLTKKTLKGAESSPSDIKLSVRRPLPKEIAMLESLRADVVARVQLLQDRDKAEGTAIGDGVTVEAYTVSQVALNKVDYGTIYFAKVEIGNDLCLHIRAHKLHGGKLEFHSLDTSDLSLTWAAADPLVYFDF